MSQRLQVLLEEDEFRAIRRAAKARRLTVAEWVRGALREAREAEPAAAPERKLAIVRAASRHAFPTAEIDQMLAEIERGDRVETAVATAIGNSVQEAEP